MRPHPWPTAEFAALPVVEQIEGYAMEPDILLDGDFAILVVSHEMTRIARLVERDEIRHRAFHHAVAFWWPWSILLAMALSALVAISIQ